MNETSKILSCVILDKDARQAEKTFNELNQYSFINAINFQTELLEALALLSQQPSTFLMIDADLLIQNDNYRIINKVFPKNRVVVTGNSGDDFINALTIGGYHYLDKPLEKSSLLEVIRKIYQDCMTATTGSGSEAEVDSATSNGLFVKGDTGYVRIDFDEIDYIKAFGEYAKLYKGDKWVLLLCTLKKITEQLPGRTFARVHRSFTVRIGSIMSFDAHEIKIGNQYVPIGRNYKKDFESSLLTLA